MKSRQLVNLIIILYLLFLKITIFWKIFPNDEGEEFKQFLKDFPEFKDIVKLMLNEEQEKAVTYNNEKFLSIQAGPGSGKTRVLIEKVSFMVNELGVEPESLLIITFSNKAADELKDRLIDADIPASEVQKMQVSTIHSFCLKILEETGNVGLDVIAEGNKQYLFIKKHLEDLGFKNECQVSNSEINTIIKKYGEYSTFKVDTKDLAENYIEKEFPVDSKFVDFVCEYMEKNNGEFPSDEIKQLKKDGNTLFDVSYTNAKYLQIALSYEDYLELLESENAIDYDQMQIRALDKLNGGYMPKYTNIFIDEFQDTDPIQMGIFRKFIQSPQTESFTVVGDVNQSIYAFKGSNKNYFKVLMEEFPDKFIELFLVTNYRSTEEIIDISQDFISAHYDSKNKLRPAKCGSGKNNDVYFMISKDYKSEANNIVEIIRYLKNKGLKYSDIGILMRSFRSGSYYQLTKLLKTTEIPYRVTGEGDLGEKDELKYILTLMYHLIQEDDPYYSFVPPQTAQWLNYKTLTGANGNNVLYELSDDTKEILNDLHKDFEDEVVRVDAIVREEFDFEKRINKMSGIFSSDKPDKRRKEVFSRIEKPILSDENIIEYGIKGKDLEFFHKLNDLKRRVHAEKYYDRPTLSEVYFELLCDITGYLTEENINDKNQQSVVNNLSSIIPLISDYSEVMYDRGLRGAFWFIHRAISNIDAYKPEEDAVQIMTVHKSKGLEFPVVIMAALRDNGFPVGFRDPEESKTVDYTPDEYLTYSRYEDDDIENAHNEEEERIIYVAKTRAEDELIFSSIVKDNEEEVQEVINNLTEDTLKGLNKGPERINEVINDNLDYCRLIDPDNIHFEKILKPKDKKEKDEIINLSFTALQNYNECPFKYKLSDELGFAFKEKKEIDDGIFIHSALEIINKKIKAENNQYIGDEDVSETVGNLFERANLLFKEEDPEKYDKKLQSITKDVLKYYHKVGNHLTILNSEYPFYIKGKDYAFSGVVDLIYEKDGKVGIIDYKNTSLVSEKYLNKYRKQLHLYVMALRDKNNKFEGRKIEEIQVFAIKYEDKDTDDEGNGKDKLFSFEIDEEYIKNLKDELKNTAEKIKKGKFDSSCEDCQGCPYQKICKK